MFFQKCYSMTNEWRLTVMLTARVNSPCLYNYYEIILWYLMKRYSWKYVCSDTNININYLNVYTMLVYIYIYLYYTCHGVSTEASIQHYQINRVSINIYILYNVQLVISKLYTQYYKNKWARSYYLLQF